MRLNKVVSVLGAVMLLAACSSTTTQNSGGAKSTGGLDQGNAAAASGWKDELVKPVSEAKAPEAGSQEELVVSIGDRVLFGVDKYDVSPEARATLDKQAKWLKSYGNLRVVVEGHCDERGTREYNLALGERRANAVKNYLVSAGVDPNRIETISYGKERPESLGSDESAWAKNRRAVTVVR